MTILEIYVYFGLPVILLGMGFGALWLVNNDPYRDQSTQARGRRVP